MRLERLREFWDRVRQNPFAQMLSTAPFLQPWAANALTISAGVRGFFEPNPWAFAGVKIPVGAELAGYYSTRPLERTLEKLTDHTLLNSGRPRLTVGAANLKTAEMRYFDSRDMPLTVKHIMASGALPPAFSAIRIDEELYWDGGILSNTPTERIFDDHPRRNSLIFAVHLWHPAGPEPETIWQILNRQKDIQYSSRIASHIMRQLETHKLRHVIMKLLDYVPEDVKGDPLVKELAGYSCKTRMHVVRLLAPRLERESHTKDIDFSPAGIRKRWETGYADTLRTLTQQPWIGEFDFLDAVVLHEPDDGPTADQPSLEEVAKPQKLAAE